MSERVQIFSAPTGRRLDQEYDPKVLDSVGSTPMTADRE